MRSAFSQVMTGLAAAAAVTLSAGCAGSGSQVSSSALPAAGAIQTLGVAAHTSGAWMLPAAKTAKSILIYAAPADTENINVYDYSSGAQVGMLTGLPAAAGCVDAAGNVYVVSGNGTALEYAHGGTAPIQTYSPGGDLVGCSVDAKGDFAVTAASPGAVTVYAKGNPSESKTYSNAACEVMSAMGYDDMGNLIGVGQYTSTNVCALLRGAKQETTLTTSGLSIKAPNGSMWDGQYLEIGDQEAGGNGLTGLNEMTLSGTTLTSHGEVLLNDTCYRGLVDVLNPFVVGKKNTPVNKHQGSVVIGSNRLCQPSNGLGIEFWHYPQGGNPFKTYSTTQSVDVLAVSIGT
jgi:hypothetical protein